MVPAPDQTATEIMDSEHENTVETFVNSSKSEESNKDIEEREQPVDPQSPTNDDLSVNNQHSNVTNGEVSATSAVSTALLPSLRGLMSYAGSRLVCKGKWAMTDADHSNPLLTSDFEFQLVRSSDDSTAMDGEFPINGVYEGWFNVKQPAPLRPIKVEDKDMIMTFHRNNDNDDFVVTGQGYNSYGKFNLRGTLTKDGKAGIYREYYLFNTPAAVNMRKTIEKKKKPTTITTAPAASSSGAIPPPPPTLTPRESAGRPRKPSLVMKDYLEKQQQQQAAAALKEKEREKAAEAAAAAAAAAKPQFPTVTSERSHRLQPALKKCAELLKDFVKLNQAVWFLEPVDPVKFNIPEYPKIIKHPMDFSTIRKNLESGAYESADDFAAHMRLVFKNAITFNTDPTSLVHIAAKELGNRFEDKLRNLQAMLQPDFVASEPRPVKTPGGSGKMKGSSSSAMKRVSSDKELAARRKSMPGPRVLSSSSFVPPAALDSNTLLMLEMQKKMENMESELRTLRATVQETALKDRVDETVEAAKKPLTLDEKKSLVAQIYKLSPDKMDHALDIIRESIATGPDDGEVEIPIDSLDTLTLRRLQKFIQENTEKKKRPSAPSLSRQGSSTREPAAKKAKKASIGGRGNGSLLADDGDLALFDENEPLLFENDQLDSTPLRGDSGMSQMGNAEIQKSVSAYHDDDDDDDDGNNRWAQAVREDDRYV